MARNFSRLLETDMGMSPQEFLGGGSGMEANDNPEDPNMLLGVDPKRDAPMARTLRDISNGVPAPGLRWSGPPVNPETGQPDTDSRFAVDKPVEAPKALSPEEFLGRKPNQKSDWEVDLESAWKSAQGFTADEFRERNILTNIGAFLYKKAMGLTTESSGVGRGPQLEEVLRNSTNPELRSMAEVDWKSAPAAFAREAGKRPVTTLVELLKGLAYDPELLGLSGIKALHATSTTGKVIKGAGVGAGVMGAMTTAQQLREKEALHAEEIGGSAFTGAVVGGAVSLLGGLRKGKGKTPAAEEPPKAATEQDYNSPQEFTADLERAAQAESLSAIDKARNAEKQAYDLMQSGASKKQVEAIRKQNPAVGEALDRMMERRRQVIEGFGETLQGEVIPADQYIPDFRFDNKNRPEAPPVRRIGTPTLRLTGPDSPALEDLSGRFAAEGAARDAAQAAAEAAARQPTGRGTLFQQRMPDGRLEPVDTGMRGATPDTLQNLGTDLQRAAQKQAAGQGFAMTAEERIAWNKATWAKEHLQGGKADPRLLALMAATGLTVAGFLALDPKDQEDAKVLGLAAAMTPVPGALKSLGSLLKSEPYSFKLLERLPQDRHTFTKKQVWEQVARADVPQAEKELVRYTLLQHQGDTITAAELVRQLNADTADWTLTPKHTNQFADYGLQHIDRERKAIGARTYNASHEEWQRQEVYPHTLMYELPFEVGVNNHFDNPNLFGWTRHFTEDRKRHVVEIQSDLVQKLGRQEPLTPETLRLYQQQIESNRIAEQTLARLDFAKAVEGDPTNTLAALSRKNSRSKDAMRANLGHQAMAHGFAGEAGQRISRGDLTDLKPSDRIRWLESARNTAIQNWRVHSAELRTKMQKVPAVSRLGPLTSNWEARLIREELAQEAKERRVMQESLAEKQKQLQDTSDPQLRAFVEEYIKATESLLQKTATVRFATPDTVAKVEGWPRERPAGRFLGLQELRRALEIAPESERAAIQELIDQDTGVKPYPFKNPAHQSIYDRYRRVVEPILRKLGGTDYTDPQGHTWIEVPVKPEHAQPKMFGQAGAVDPRLLARMAALGLGVTVGLWASDRDHKWTGAALGALVGMAAGRSPSALVAGWKKIWAADTRFRIDNLTNAWEYSQDRAAKLVWDLQRSVEKLVPDEAGRKRITAWLDGDRTVQLSGAEQRAAAMVRTWFDGMKQAATKAGVLKTSLDDYVTHLWNWKIGKAQSPIVQAYLDRLEGQGTGMGTSSPYAKKRSFSTLEEGKRNGLTPLTEDISAIVGIYSNSMSRAMANKGLLEGLKQGKMPNGMGLVIPSAKAPYYYKYINAPQLAGVMVHPDIAPSLEFLFSQAPRGVIPAVLEMLNTAIKRVQLSFSLFHVKALTDAGIAGTSHPLRFLKKLPQYALGTTELLQQLRQQGVAPLIDLAYKCGLKFGLEKGKLVVEDVGMDSFYAGMKSLEKGLDGVFQGLGKPIKGLAEVNHAFDKFMWDRVHTGMKLDMFAEKVEVLLESSAKRHAKDPSLPVLTREQAGVIAASFTNDLFGGLNWRRIAEQAHTTWGRNLALQVYAKQGRWWMQLAIFAPDWTLSTTRAMVKAFGKGSGPRGLIDPITLADLHRQYIARAAAIYFTVGNILNQALSGKWLWENEDWTSIDRGDGRWLQWSKHTMEPVHWMQKPGQQGLNKFGILPKEALEQVLDVEYLSTKGNMRPMEGDRVAHAAKKLLPISVGQSFETGAESGLMGFAGMPVYGRSDTQRANDRLKRRLERLDRLGEDRGK